MEERYSELQSLAHYFKGSMERDKRYMAIELHEELAQLASMVKMNMGWLDSHLGELPENLRSRIQQVSMLSERMVHTIRKMVFSISPGMLEDLGLHETMEWLCREFTHLKGIPCQFESNLEASFLPQEIAMDFFRICQQTLLHLVSSPSVRAVSIFLDVRIQKACLAMQVAGLDLHPSGNRQDLDVEGLRKRVASVNGSLSITFDPDKGTLMTVCVPQARKEARI